MKEAVCIIVSQSILKELSRVRNSIRKDKMIERHLKNSELNFQFGECVWVDFDDPC